MKKEKQMTAPPGADASFDQTKDWRGIHWKPIQQQVRRLQVRIAKAVKEGKHRRALALQWLLTHSRAARWLAVRMVTTNKGAKTPGVDKVIWRTNRQKLQAADNCQGRNGTGAKWAVRNWIFFR